MVRRLKPYGWQTCISSYIYGIVFHRLGSNDTQDNRLAKIKLSNPTLCFNAINSNNRSLESKTRDKDFTVSDIQDSAFNDTITNNSTFHILNEMQGIVCSYKLH